MTRSEAIFSTNSLRGAAVDLDLKPVPVLVLAPAADGVGLDLEAAGDLGVAGDFSGQEQRRASSRAYDALRLIAILHEVLGQVGETPGLAVPAGRAVAGEFDRLLDQRSPAPG